MVAFGVGGRCSLAPLAAAMGAGESVGRRDSVCQRASSAVKARPKTMTLPITTSDSSQLDSPLRGAGNAAPSRAPARGVRGSKSG